MQKIQPQFHLFTVANFLTSLSFLFIWTAIILLLNESYFASFALAMLAFIVDFFDGYWARKLNQSSAFGRQLDGHIDVFTYLLYPALVYHFWFDYNGFVWSVLLFMYIACGIFRLTRFSVVGLIHEEDSDYYQGVPVVFSYLFLLAVYGLQLLNPSVAEFLAAVMIILHSILMVQRFTFRKPKQFAPIIFTLALLAVLTLIREIIT